MLVGIGVVERGWMLLVAWLGADFFILGIAHLRGTHGMFGKRASGTLPFWSWLLYLPLLFYTGAVWRLLILFNREPAQNFVGDDLAVGRRLLSRESIGEFSNYVDLTSEFVESDSLRKRPGYFCFPILDGAAPDIEALNQALDRLRPGKTFIHCAQGHGRTGLFALALLLRRGVVRDVEEGIQILKAARPKIALNREQRRCLERFVAKRNENPNSLVI